MMSLAVADGQKTLDSENSTKVERSREPSQVVNEMWITPEAEAGEES